MNRNRRPSIPIPPAGPSGHGGSTSSIAITSTTTTTTRVAKSSEQYAAFGGLSHTTFSSGASATPQQKIVQVLVARLKSKLPYNSGLRLDEIEADTATQQAVEALVTLSNDSMDVIAWALSELLERLAIPEKDKPQPAATVLSVEVVQSQLFVMKVLTIALASRWYNGGLRPKSRASTSSPLPHRSMQTDQQSFVSAQSELSPLDDNCAKYILSVMVLYLRQTHTGETPLMLLDQTTDISFTDYETASGVDSWFPASQVLLTDPVGTAKLKEQSSKGSLRSDGPGSATSPAAAMTYEPTVRSAMKSPHALNSLLAKFTGRVIFQLSASNWPVVFHRLRTKLHYLASPEVDRVRHPPDLVDLQILSHGALNRERLIVILQELSALLLNLKEDHMAIAPVLRVALWNWIDQYPEEFNDAMRTKGAMEGSPERTFDLLYQMSTTPESNKAVWPTLAILQSICSDRVSPELLTPSAARQKRPDVRFSEDIIRHSQLPSRLSETALVCAVDVCRVASRIQPEGEVPVRLIAFDLAPELKSSLRHSMNGQKPFWDMDEIDVPLYASALVGIFRFLPEEDSLPLFEECLLPERSDAVKLTVVRACVTLVQEATLLPWQRPLENLAALAGPRFYAIFMTGGRQRGEIDANGRPQRSQTYPKLRRRAPQPLSDGEVLMLGVISLWCLSPGFFPAGRDGGNSASQEAGHRWVEGAIKVWESGLDISVKASTITNFICVTLPILMVRELPEMGDHYVTHLKYSMPLALISFSTNLLRSRIDTESTRMWTSAIHRLLRLYSVNNDAEHVKAIQTDPDRVAAFVLVEIALLVTLTSEDSQISQLAARGLRYIAYLENLPGAPAALIADDEQLSQRHIVYEQLGDPRVMIVGRVGYQKRMRKLLRILSFPSVIHVAVWQECYWRWVYLYNFIKETVDEATAIPESRDAIIQMVKEKRHAYENLTLFLAALSGACVQDGIDLKSLVAVFPAQQLPDQMREIQNPVPLVTKFINAMTDQLVIDDTYLRENARAALGGELSPRLYPKLLKHFDETVRQISGFAGSDLADSYALFVDQFSAVLKLIIENTNVRADEIMSIDVGQTIVSLALFIARFDSYSAARLRLKFCALCDAVCDRTDTLTLRKDSPARQKILDIVMEWMQSAPTTNTYELGPTQNELNIACLRTCVKLLERLQIQPQDEASTGDDSVHQVSRLFHKYAAFLLRGQEECQLETVRSDNVSEAGSMYKNRAAIREAELRELIITGLAHLVGANSEHGFKQCLPLAYDADTRKRVIFANVFARVIGQGTKFDVEDRVVGPGRHNRLAELVKGSDMVLVMAICETCPPAEVEMMISVMLNLFDTRKTLMSLLKLMIDREVANTDSETALFRSNSTCTRFLSAFAKVHGYAYLRSLIIPLIRSMASVPPGHGYELDPDKPDVGEAKAAQNLENVKFVAASFLEIISSSIPALPPMFREICAHISRVVSRVWPDAKFSAMGAFIFLRFISPAIVAPETIDVELPKDLSQEAQTTIRRGLMVIAKIIQNLANNLFFGKEKHMVPLNTFLQANIAIVTRFLSELNKYQAPAADSEENDEWLGTTSDDTDIIVLHRFFHKHADKIGKELLSLSKPSENDSSVISGKHAWDELCGLLVELGTPLDIPKLSSALSHEHRDYLDLLSRHAHRSTESVKAIFLETDTPRDKPAVFLFCLSKIDVEALDIELLMYHIFKTLALPMYQNRPFDIVLDCTAFTGISELPLQWLKFCAELMPSDIRTRFDTTYILNSNTLTQKYMRRLYNFAAGTPFCSVIKAYSSVTELRPQLPPAALDKLVYPAALEAEVGDEFSDISMRLQQMRFPITLLVGETHVRITSVRAQTISPGLSCKSTEIISLMDVSDVYNVSSIGQDAHEFIIRRAQQGTTVYFSSPSREAIVKAIRSAKGRLKDTATPLAERFSRFSNIPATLLHVGMLTVDLNDEELRAAGYELLGAVCSYLSFDKSSVVAAKSGFVPGDAYSFIQQLSESLADFVPQLTLDFVSEIAAAMTSIDRSQISQRVSCVQYMSPWIKNFALFVIPTSPLYERSGARVRDAIRVLCDMSTGQPELTTATQRYVWSEVGKLDPVVVDVVLDELIRAATDGGVGSTRCETIGMLLASMTSISVRGKLIFKLRKSLTKQTGGKPPRTLSEYPNWGEISTLVRLCHTAGYQTSRAAHNLLYVPEILHLITLTAAVGPSLVRKSVYGIVINLLQAMYIGRTEEAPSTELLQLLSDCESDETQKLFGLSRLSQSSEYVNYDVMGDIARVDNQEKLVEILVRILEVAAGSRGLLNVWQARWMGLATSTAFQYSPAIQLRSFTTLGTLLTQEADDDYLYQMLVALKTALQQASEQDSAIVVTMLRSLAKVVPALPDSSRYFASLFWLAVALLESGHVIFYVEAATLLSVTIESMRARDMFRHGSVATVLLEGRDALEGVLGQFDQILSISFDTNFSFALASVLFKGMRASIVRKEAEKVLRTLLSVTMRPYAGEGEMNGARDALSPDALGYFIALLTVSTTHAAYRRLLKESNLGDVALPETSGIDDGTDAPRVQIPLLGIDGASTALLAASFIGAVVTTAQGNDAETEMLYCLLSDIATSYPEVVTMTYDGLQDKIRDIFSKASNPTIIRAVSHIFRIAQDYSQPRAGFVPRGGGSTSTLSTVEESGIFTPGRSHLEALEELNMAGVASNFVFLPLQGGMATKVINWIPELVNLMVQ
ncbi:hypothetical protein FB45DRAFT_146957 [Roridomyces roridus]|uniref:Ras-GAP domain-containing protein n=1 Tax=Roridomyces roridus TaxID=1738132 RepID=A0AAD7BG74_9AGAR|nr:hypothetical protein FB45DRAFT_146957 [Roridomyces roridus]